MGRPSSIHRRSPTRTPSFRAPPFHRHATRLFIRHANQFRASTHVDGAGLAVETPYGILVDRAILLLRKVYLGGTDTKPRRSKGIDQAAAADAIQGRDVVPGTRGCEVFVSLAADGKLDKALAKGLEQCYVSRIVPIVTRRGAAGSQKRSEGEGGGTQQFWVTRNHRPMMPPLVSVCVAGAEPTLSRFVRVMAAPPIAACFRTELR